MNGKLCLVTGATSGIGEATALELARLGARVVVAGRSPERCQATAESIRSKTGNQEVETLVADMSSQADVRRLAREFLDRHDRLDVLVNNAGGLFMNRRVSVDGIEMTLALNHLGYFLLTSLLLDALKAASPSRIVNVSSAGHFVAKRGIEFDDLQRKRIPYRGFHAYHQSKLANLLFSFELARRLEGTGVTVNALDPGTVETSIGKNNGRFWRLLTPIYFKVFNLQTIPAEEGARTVVYLASSAEVEGVSGLYFAEGKPVPSSFASRDEAAAKRLWDLSENLVAPSVTRKI